MPYTREELDRIEDAWSSKLHGRPTFISGEDYHQLQIWSDAGVSVDDIINAIDAFSQRRMQRSKGRSFAALSYLANDVARAVKLSSGVELTEALKENVHWNVVKEPMRSDLRGRILFKTWQRIRATAPHADSPAFLTYFDAERKAFKELAAYAESHLGDKSELLRMDLKAKLLESKIVEGTTSWCRAWEHHWMRIVCDFWRIPWQL